MPVQVVGSLEQIGHFSAYSVLTGLSSTSPLP